MKKSTKRIITTITVMALLACFIIWLFYTITNKPQIPLEKNEKTEAEILIGKNIASNYPQSPREVLRLYGRITKCMYNDEVSEEDFGKLADQLRLLYDQELLDKNERDFFIVSLQAEIDNYKQNNIKIASYDVQDGYDTDYATIDKGEYATLRITFLVMQQGKNRSYEKSYEQFLLRKSKEDEWRIVHWKLIDRAAVEE